MPPAEPTGPHRAGLPAYLKRAFVYHWNLGLLAMAVAGSLLSPWPDAMLPLVGALEALYLGGLVGLPKFREAIDAEANAGRQRDSATPSIIDLIAGLGLDAQTRFNALRHRCAQMQSLANDLRGPDTMGDVAGSMRTSGLNQLLWGFLRLLHHQAALGKLLASMDGADITLRSKQIADGLAKARAANDERLVHSFEERAATAAARLEHYDRTRKDLAFVGAELDRIEDKIQALSEMAVNQSDANALSTQIDATAASMQATESRLSEFQASSAVFPDLNSAPAILPDDSRGGRRLRA
jgi:hypothetical protein